MFRRASFLLTVVCIAAAITAILFPPTSPAQSQEGSKYLGSAKCKMCHQDQHQIWSEMHHSKAWEVLTPEQVATGKDMNDRACVQCHTTGYGKPGGFVSAEKTPKLKSVGCEACHGPGGLHLQTMLTASLNDENPKDKKISKNLGCSACHNPHISHKKVYGKKDGKK
jgi:uncharacterized paraquat-inducible protein A